MGYQRQEALAVKTKFLTGLLQSKKRKQLFFSGFYFCPGVFYWAIYCVFLKKGFYGKVGTRVALFTKEKYSMCISSINMRVFANSLRNKKAGGSGSMKGLLGPHIKLTSQDSGITPHVSKCCHE